VPYFICRSPRCDDHAYAHAAALDAFVLNTIDEAAHALADRDGYLSDTTLRRALGDGVYLAGVSDYVAAVNKAEADLAAAREASSGSFELVGRLWNTEWTWHDKRDWLGRMVASVVPRGREPLSRRADAELR
jgi:hypothetical protein